MDCQKVRESQALWLDGDLPEPEAAAIGAHLASCEACAGWVAGDLRLAEGLSAAYAGEDGAGGGSRPRGRWGGWWRFTTGAVAAAALVLLALRFLLPVSGSPGSPPELLARPGARYEPLAEGARLESGELFVRSGASARVIHTPLGAVEVRGTATVAVSVDEAGEAGVRVAVWEGEVRRDETGADPRVLRPGAVLALGSWSEEGSEAERPREESLRMEQLLAENRTLRLRVAMLSEKAPEAGEDELERAVLALREELRAEEEASDDEAFYRRACEAARTLARLHPGRDLDLLGAVREHLLGGSDRERAYGLFLLGELSVPEAAPLARQEVAARDETVRFAAVELLARVADERYQDALGARLRDEAESERVRVSAAGGLVRLGDVEEPLAWLLGAYQREGDARLRRRIFARVLLAPARAIEGFLIEAARDETLDAFARHQAIELLAEAPGERAETALLDLLENAEDEELRRVVLQALSAV